MPIPTTSFSRGMQSIPIIHTKSKEALNQIDNGACGLAISPRAGLNEVEDFLSGENRHRPR